MTVSLFVCCALYYEPKNGLSGPTKKGVCSNLFYNDVLGIINVSMEGQVVKAMLLPPDPDTGPDPNIIMIRTGTKTKVSPIFCCGLIRYCVQPFVYVTLEGGRGGTTHKLCTPFFSVLSYVISVPFIHNLPSQQPTKMKVLQPSKDSLPQPPTLMLSTRPLYETKPTRQTTHLTASVSCK